ncbi:hypothetical protein P280DRAFT_472612 [Massarina eburnea CBS 473.64]|uniref:Large ribosomal subunit protein uL23m n=1 Tax=Massarina eburnea CBS 473.64 TaxID=1395130 RepID=A0A6A6RPN3_9PLEO|nr:hypothetical protein P280DRAFT_472612 [Massarina eburnea CBS 473.64]
MDTASAVTKKVIAFGSKQVFLPKFTIALVRTPNLSPYHARFLVPLNFSKYDLRDYLYHAYSIKTHNIRSFVKQMPVRDTIQLPRHWFREQSKKYMTVEMEQPFVWPEDPKSWEPWGKDENDDRIKEAMRMYGSRTMSDKRKEAEGIREQARAFLRGDVEGGWDLEGKTKAKGEGETEAKKEFVGKGDGKTLLQRWEEKRTPVMLGRRALRTE